MVRIGALELGVRVRAGVRVGIIVGGGGGGGEGACG